MAETKRTMVAPKKERAGISRGVYFLTVAVMLAVGFAAGTRSNDLLAAIGPVFGLKVASGTLDLSSVQQTYRQLSANYDGTLDVNELINGASRGMVAAAGDKYTVYMDAKEATAFNDDLTGNIGGGIGAEIGIRDDTPTIVRILPGNPAEKAGLKAGDSIIGINDQSSSDWTSEKAAKEIRGEVGTTVKLTVLRDNEQKTFTVTRQTVDNPSVDSRIEDGVGILSVTRFDEQTGMLARKAAEGFKERGVKGVVLDLRDNGGGYITAAQDVAGLWLDNKLVVSERAGGKTVDELRSDSNPVLAGVPTVVLVNEYTASASEIVSGALQDYDAATLIGKKTFGKGTVQKLLELGGGARLKVTVARWFTPGGRNIDKEGIAPDRDVELTAKDANKGRDPQMAAALERLKR